MKNSKNVIVSYKPKFFNENYDEKFISIAAKLSGKLQGKGFCFKDSHRDLVFRMDAGKVPAFRKALKKYDGVLGVKAVG